MASETSGPHNQTQGANESSATAGPGDRDRVVMLDQAAPRAIEWTAERIATGGVVAIPTDTVYGVAASLAHPMALDRIYAVKGRSQNQPLPVLVSSVSALERLVKLDKTVIPLFDAFWPGPLTVVLPAASHLPSHVLGPGNSVGVRLPNHYIAIEVIEKSGGAIACTSANRSGEPPARSALGVAETIGPDVDLILDGGIVPGGIASTVVAVTGLSLSFIREGAIPMPEVIRIWDEVVSDR